MHEYGLDALSVSGFLQGVSTGLLFSGLSPYVSVLTIEEVFTLKLLFPQRKRAETANCVWVSVIRARVSQKYFFIYSCAYGVLRWRGNSPWQR